MLDNKKITLQKQNLSWIWIPLFVILIDRVSKYFVAKYLILNQSINIFPSLNLFYTLNKGAAFSFLNQASGWQIWLFAGVAIGVSLFIIEWLLRIDKNRVWQSVSLALILGGTLGNLFDRLYYGYVTDFIDVYFAVHHWPSFNIADSAICIGAVMLIIDVIFKKA